MNEDLIVELAIKSLIQEVSLHPKPGLVDPLDCGAHDDMDYYTFLDSCFALAPGFRNYYRTGQAHQGSPRALFDKIRSVGLKNEESMFAATANINTHKGANFLYGVAIAAIAYLKIPTLDELRLVIKEMTAGIVEEELASLTAFKTHGEKVYQEFGYTGIRGEVEAGLPLVFDVALPIIREGNNYQESLKRALVELIKVNNDSNMLKRGGIEGLNYGKKLAQKTYVNIDDHLSMMNDEFIQKNLNPGGTADLLALAIFMKMYDEELINKQ